MSSGFNYIHISQGSFGRHAWPQPREYRTGSILQTEQSAEGCRKKRTAVLGHKSRTGLWIWVCMRHSMIIAFHVIIKGEGRRDPLLSLYRFKETPPSVVFVDCACQAEESAMNWVPQYYRNTRFFHDTFHGFAHKCCARFEGRHQRPHLPEYNTSLMEQVNSFIQPLRALVFFSDHQG